MNLHEATKALTEYIAEHLHEWADADPSYTTGALPGIFAGTNAVLDGEKRILTAETLDDLYAAYSWAATAENKAHQPSNPAGSPRAEAAAERMVHDYLDDANLALLRAGYDGERLRADTLEQITKA